MAVEEGEEAEEEVEDTEMEAEKDRTEEAEEGRVDTVTTSTRTKAEVNDWTALRLTWRDVRLDCGTRSSAPWGGSRGTGDRYGLGLFSCTCALLWLERQVGPRVRKRDEDPRHRYTSEDLMWQPGDGSRFNRPINVAHSGLIGRWFKVCRYYPPTFLGIILQRGATYILTHVIDNGLNDMHILHFNCITLFDQSRLDICWLHLLGFEWASKVWGRRNWFPPLQQSNGILVNGLDVRIEVGWC